MRTEGARLVLSDTDGVTDRQVLLDRDRLVLGRSADCDVVIPHPQVSRHHAEVRRSGGTWVLRDLGSTHGTTRGRIRLAGPVALVHGDVVCLGPVRLRFLDPAAESPTLLGPAPPGTRPDPRGGTPRGGLAVHDQWADAINNVEGVQNNYVQQVLHERQSFLREVAASRTRARRVIIAGVVLLVAGLGLGMLTMAGLLSNFSDAASTFPEGSSSSTPPTTDPFDGLFEAHVAGMRIALVAEALVVAGLLLVIVGVVLHVVATARRRDVDARHPIPDGSPRR